MKCVGAKGEKHLKSVFKKKTVYNNNQRLELSAPEGADELWN